jgi:succinate dehydrogenase flavin-adding protein (antitoxin of CptAB toxin-antitoxin module)
VYVCVYVCVFVFMYVCISPLNDGRSPATDNNFLWQPPVTGILEVDIIVMNVADHNSGTIHPNDFQILTKAMESTGSDSAKLSLLKQALAGVH